MLTVTMLISIVELKISDKTSQRCTNTEKEFAQRPLDFVADHLLTCE